VIKLVPVIIELVKTIVVAIPGLEGNMSYTLEFLGTGG
jgi:hypothetical protein